MDKIKEYLNIFLICVGIICCFFAIVFFVIQIDNSNLSQIRYCPNCGIDLIR